MGSIPLTQDSIPPWIVSDSFYYTLLSEVAAFATPALIYKFTEDVLDVVSTCDLYYLLIER